MIFALSHRWTEASLSPWKPIINLPFVLPAHPAHCRFSSQKLDLMSQFLSVHAVKPVCCCSAAHEADLFITGAVVELRWLRVLSPLSLASHLLETDESHQVIFTAACSAALMNLFSYCSSASTCFLALHVSFICCSLLPLQMLLIVVRPILAQFTLCLLSDPEGHMTYVAL